jgi:hypothetical protein
VVCGVPPAKRTCQGPVAVRGVKMGVPFVAKAGGRPGYKSHASGVLARELDRHPPLEPPRGAPPSGPPPADQSSSTPPLAATRAYCAALFSSQAGACRGSSSSGCRRLAPPPALTGATSTPTPASNQSLVSHHSSPTSSPADSNAGSPEFWPVAPPSMPKGYIANS